LSQLSQKKPEKRVSRAKTKACQEGRRTSFTQRRKARKEGQTHNFLLANGQREPFRFLDLSKSEIEISVFKQFLAFFAASRENNLFRFSARGSLYWSKTNAGRLLNFPQENTENLVLYLWLSAFIRVRNNLFR
jgi:hypothetical protein